MKIEYKVTEITHEDIVNLLATARYGNSEMDVDFAASDYKKVPKEKRHGTFFEDKCADILLNGGHITVVDVYAEEEVYNKNNLPVKVNKDGSVEYQITISNILSAFENPEVRHNVTNIIEDNYDLYDAYNILQVACFGEVIYG